MIFCGNLPKPAITIVSGLNLDFPLLASVFSVITTFPVKKSVEFNCSISTHGNGFYLDALSQRSYNQKEEVAATIQINPWTIKVHIAVLLMEVAFSYSVFIKSESSPCILEFQKKSRGIPPFHCSCQVHCRLKLKIDREKSCKFLKISGRSL